MPSGPAVWPLTSTFRPVPSSLTEDTRPPPVPRPPIVRKNRLPWWDSLADPLPGKNSVPKANRIARNPGRIEKRLDVGIVTGLYIASATKGRVSANETRVGGVTGRTLGPQAKKRRRAGRPGAINTETLE